MSPIFDMDAINNAPDEAGRQPGIYYCRIANADGDPSQNGNPMISFELIEVSTDRLVCYDRMMFAGKPFALTLTKRKLKALGIDITKPLEATDLNGLRCWVSVAYGKPNAKGRSYLEPNFSAEGSAFGYYPDGEHPLADPSQAATLLVEEPPRAGRASWPAGITKATDLPKDHPDYAPF